ncbi:hypothetical protein ACWFMI_23910 [Nocardiopsis terrae]
MPPWQKPVQEATTHVDQITQLLSSANEALDESWETGDTNSVTTALSRIQREARRGRTALRRSCWSTLRSALTRAA